jgi:CBS domain containing-hemolysin-like protein
MISFGELGLLLLLLLCSAFFSGSETSFFSLSPLRLKKLEDDGEAWAGEILAILGDKQRLLITLLLGNTLVNVVATTLVARLIIGLVTVSEVGRETFGGSSAAVGIALASALMTFVILIFGEIMPKTLAIHSSLKFARLARWPLRFFLMVLYLPVVFVIWLLKIVFPGSSDWNRKLGSATSLEEIDSYFSLGEEVGIIERDEKEMISSVFEFGDTLVREVMVPRPDMMALPINVSLDSMLKFFREDGHSRFPLYEGNLDKIVGIIYVKDVLLRYEEIRENFDIFKLLRPAYFVPETKKLDDMLREFQKRKIHLAIVVDEFGGVSGLVTIEDLLEEIVGEIVDEYDHDEQEAITLVEPNVYSVDAKVNIKDLEMEMGISLAYEDSETVGGFVLEKLGRIPKREEKVEEPQAVFVVSELKGNRILRVRIIRKEPANTLEAPSA